MIGIIDYGAGNIQSVINAFKAVGAQARLVSDSREIMSFDRLVLPGVGAFGEAMNRLDDGKFIEPIRDFTQSGRPFLGICLGMQLLFDRSFEFGERAGLGLLKGDVIAFDETKFTTPLKVPHVGWNGINFTRQTPINSGLKESEYFYFVHSFHVVCDDEIVLGVSEYGYKFCSAVAKDNIYGFQPHPEKSHDVGLKIIKNFTELK